MSAKRLNRKIHRWAGIITAIPVIIILITGILLLLKKDVAWIQPPSQKGSSQELKLSFEEILAVVSKVPDVNLKEWKDIDRLDVRPKKGLIKVRGKNDWEVQLDSKTGEVLQVAERRSDFIESIHDGSYFHDYVKLGLFLPVAILLVGIWGTGLYLFLSPYMGRKRQYNKTSTN